MAKTKETAGANGELSAFAPFHALFAGTWGGNKMFTEALRASQQEMLDFAIKRLHHTEEALETCKSCKDPLAFVSAQQTWLAETMKEYYDESAHFGERMRKTASESMALAGKSHESAAAA